eukprot:maker-scaffold_34-snap-gene-1.24-mRNA-1 protein AED:0.00 eAED:0.00 QI:183/1/1/1/1/1/2/63/483
MSYFSVVVPPGVQRGKDIQVRLPNDALFNIPVPWGMTGGETLIISAETYDVLVSWGVPKKMFEVTGPNDVQTAKPTDPPMEVVIPEGVKPGKKFPVTLASGKNEEIRVPPGSYAGSVLYLNRDTGAALLKQKKMKLVGGPPGGQALRKVGTPVETVKEKIKVEDPVEEYVVSEVEEIEEAVSIRESEVDGEEEKEIEEQEDDESVESIKKKEMDIVSYKEYNLNFSLFAEDLEYAKNHSAEMEKDLKPFSSWFTFKTPENRMKEASDKSASLDKYIQPTGRLRALFFINDDNEENANTFKEALLSQGFTDTPETMVTLQKEDSNPLLEITEGNIVNSFHWLMENVAPGDVLFLYAKSEAEFFSKLKESGVWEEFLLALPNEVKLLSFLEGNESLEAGLELNLESKSWVVTGVASGVVADVTIFSSTELFQGFEDFVQGESEVSILDIALELNEKTSVQIFSSQAWDPSMRKLVINGKTYPNTN